MLRFRDIILEQEEKKIVISPSSTADTRTSDYSKVTKEQLLQSTKMHLEDVKKGLDFIIDMIEETKTKHDHDKISDIDGFYRDFQTGFETEDWYINHKKVNRHHIDKPDGVPKDVDLVDVIEFIVDCVMAGLARSGHVYTLELSNEVLQKAFQNTIEKLKNNIRVKDKLEG